MELETRKETLSKPHSETQDRMEPTAKKAPDAFEVSYIDTAKAALLAIVKLLEAIAGGYALVRVYKNPRAVQTFMRDIFSGLSVDSQSAFAFAIQILNRSIQFVAAFILILIVLDGLGAFCLRIWRRGAGLLRFVHTVRYVFSIVGACAGFAIYAQYLYYTIKTAEGAKTLHMDEVLAFLGSFELIIDLMILLYFFWIFVAYDRNVARVMKQVKIETRAGELKPLCQKNRLRRESAWLSGLFAASVALSVAELKAGSGIVSLIVDFVSPVDLPGGFNSASLVIASMLAIRFFLVNRCSADFDRAHRAPLS